MHWDRNDIITGQGGHLTATQDARVNMIISGEASRTRFLVICSAVLPCFRAVKLWTGYAPFLDTEFRWPHSSTPVVRYVDKTWLTIPFRVGVNFHFSRNKCLGTKSRVKGARVSRWDAVKDSLQTVRKPREERAPDWYQTYTSSL